VDAITGAIAITTPDSLKAKENFRGMATRLYRVGKLRGGISFEM